MLSARSIMLTAGAIPLTGCAILLTGCAIMLTGCAAGPIPVSALPGPAKTITAFNQDETACRIQAARAAYPAPAQGQAAPGNTPGNTYVIWDRFFTSYGQCETARGNYVQPVPWAIAYGLYLGIGLPYPAPYPPPPYGAPMAYGYP
jgi:hypothetical protein